MMDWQVKNALDAYNERVARALRDYEINQALKAGGGRKTSISSRILTSGGERLVRLGKRLQRWGGQDPAPQTEAPWQGYSPVVPIWFH